MDYVKESGKYERIPRGMEQLFFRPVNVASNKNQIINLKLEGKITNEDLEFLKFVNTTRFCTIEQFNRYANGKNYDDLQNRVDFFFKNGIVNKFVIVSESIDLKKVPGDAKRFYCMHDGAKVLLEHFTDEYVEWDYSDNCASSNAVNKFILNTEFYLNILFSCRVNLVFYGGNPEFIARNKVFHAGSQYCFQLPDNKPLYLIVEYIRSSDNIMQIRKKFRNFETILATNIWKKYYPDSQNPPMLFIIAENDAAALSLARDMTMTTKISTKNCRFSTDERIMGDISRIGSFLKFVPDDGGRLEETNVAIFAR